MIGDRPVATPSLVAARFRIHGLTIGVRSDQPAVIDAVARSYAGFAIDAEAVEDGDVAWIDIIRPRRRYPADPVRQPEAIREETATILGALDRFVMAVLTGLGVRGVLGTHAGVVVVGDRAVLLAGPSGRGKSTLTLQLVRDGAAWLTDELALIDADDRTVLPYPRALHVSEATVDLLPELDFLRERPRHDLGAGSEWSVSAEDVRRAFGATVAGPTPLGLIVLLDERGAIGDDPLITAATPAEATFTLLRGTPAAAGDFASTLRRIGVIASRVPVVRLRAGDPARTSAALREHVAGLSGRVDARAIARIGVLEAYRSRGRTAWIEATGRSMEPSIPAGSRLLVDFGRRPAGPGDVVVFRRGDAAVAHRLVGRRRLADGIRLVAKGDGEALLDRSIDIGDVLGVVRGIRLPDGRVDRFIPGSRRAAAVASVSWWSGRAAGHGMRLLRRAPLAPRVRRAGQRGLLALSRVPTRVVAAALPRPFRGSMPEGGETNGVREPRDPRELYRG